MFLEVIDAQYISEYKLFLSFNNGEKRVFDFASVISRYPVFRCLKDLNLFKSFIITDTVEWKNGAIDIAPEYLLENGVAVKKDSIN